MPISLDRKFKGKENYVIGLVEQMGVDTAMAMTDTKHRKTFLRWLNEVTHGEWKTSPNPLDELKGGPKDKWIKEHKALILDCLGIFGRDWVMNNFRLKPDTLERIVHSGYKGNPATTWFKQREKLITEAGQQADRNIYKILNILAEMEREQDLLRTQVKMEHEAYLETLNRQRQLEKLYYDFAENIVRRIVQALTQTLTQAIVPALKQLTPPRPKIVEPLDLTIAPEPVEAEADSK